MERRQVLTLAGLGIVLVAVLLARDLITGETLVILAVLFGSVILHEVSHGVAALRFGDDTAQRAGRLTLNPVSHVDPFGTIILPVILVLVGSAPFGWAKPVPVNPSRMRDPRNHSMLVSLAGPATNIALALIAAVALRAALPAAGLRDDLSFTTDLLLQFGAVNVLLATFNLIPIPPLDGSAVVERLLPAAWWPRYLRLRQYSMAILLVLVLALPNALDSVFEPALRFWGRLVV
jgi:Zn-dependent protease